MLHISHYVDKSVFLYYFLLDAPSGSRPALQVHHPGVTGPHKGGVPVSPGTVPQVDYTNARFTCKACAVFVGQIPLIVI